MDKASMSVHKQFQKDSFNLFFKVYETIVIQSLSLYFDARQVALKQRDEKGIMTVSKMHNLKLG